jgi:hypothetical protein
MRRTGPLGPTLRRLRRGRRPPQHLTRLVADIEAGRVIPSPAGLAQLARALELDFPARQELADARRDTVALLRATPWTVSHRRSA